MSRSIRIQNNSEYSKLLEIKFDYREFRLQKLIERILIGKKSKSELIELLNRMKREV